LVAFVVVLHSLPAIADGAGGGRCEGRQAVGLLLIHLQVLHVEIFLRSPFLAGYISESGALKNVVCPYPQPMLTGKTDIL